MLNKPKRIKKFLLLFGVLFILSCQKQDSNQPSNNNPPPPISVTQDTSQPTGALQSTAEDMEGFVFAEDLDISEIPPIGGRIANPVNNNSVLAPNHNIGVPPANQQYRNSCVGWAVGYGLMSFFDFKREHRSTYGNEDYFSPFYIYSQSLSGESGVDLGMTLGRGFKIVMAQGCCKWSDMPSGKGDDFTKQPTAEIRAKAAQYKFLQRLINFKNKDINLIKSLLVRDYPIAFRATISTGFKKVDEGSVFKTNPRDGRLIWKANSGFISYHAMLLCGYDDEIKAFKVLNSWGSNWANKGYCWVDYDFFKDVVTNNILGQPELMTAIPNFTGLIADYAFTSNAKDLSAYKNNGIVHNATLTTDKGGNANSAYYFNGTNAYIEVPNSTSLNITTSLSISCWIKPESKDPRFYPIVDKVADYSLALTPCGNFSTDNCLVQSFGITQKPAKVTLSPGNWYHVVSVTAPNKGLIMYVNGKQVYSDPTFKLTQRPSSGNPLYIGGIGHYFKGTIDEVRIYNRSLSDSEVNALFNE